jgi:hypothetical protein
VRTMLTDRATDRPLLVGLSAFADRGFHVVSVTDPYCRILDFLDWLERLVNCKIELSHQELNPLHFGLYLG